MNADTFRDIEKLESDLWGAADHLRGLPQPPMVPQPIPGQDRDEVGANIKYLMRRVLLFADGAPAVYQDDGSASYIMLGFIMARTIFEDVREFESRLGLPVNFYEQLLREDDWSFVVKLNALFEGACTHVLTTRLHAPELTDAFAQLDLANTKYGKVALLRSRGAISSEQAAILRCLAELRNALVHNITNVGFSFKTYVAKLDTNQLKKLVTNFGHGVQDTIEFADKRVRRLSSYTKTRSCPFGSPWRRSLAAFTSSSKSLNSAFRSWRWPNTRSSHSHPAT